MNPPAKDGTALKAKFCPISGISVTDYILVQAPNLNDKNYPFSSTVMEFEEIPVILPLPVLTEDGFKHVKSPAKLKSFVLKAELLKG